MFEHSRNAVPFPDTVEERETFKIAQQQRHVVPLPHEFELEKTFEFAGFLYDFISVCLFKDGNHYLCQALRENSSTGEMSFRQINDMHQIHRDKGSTYSKSFECEFPTTNVIQ